jgi:PAS domain S-box-containing protein
MKPVEILFSKGVSAHPSAEEALRQSREEFKDLFDNAPVGFHEINAEGRLVRINNTELKMLGCSAEELLGQFVWKISAEEETSRRAALAKLAGTLAPPAEGFERMFRRKDGSTFPVWINDQILKGANGVITGIRATVLDMTERKQIAGELNRERELWRALLDNSPDKVYFKDAQSRIVKCNQAMASQFGLKSPDELTGKTDFDFFDGARARPAFEDEQEIIRTGLPIIDKEERKVWNDGHVTWVSSTKLPWRDGTGKIIGTMGISRDITERKQVAEQLRLRESFLSAITENQPGLLWLKDTEGRLLTVNKAYAAACGRSDPEQIYGLTDLDLWPKELAEKYRADDRRVMSAGDASVMEEMIFIGNKHVWHETFKTPVRDDQGRVIGTTGYARDITERKLAEQQLTEALNFNRKVISDASVGIIVFNAAGRCVLANESGARTLNATMPQILAQNFREIASWQTSGMLRFAEAALATKTPQQGEFHFVSTFGKEVWLVSHFSPFVQNGEPHLLLIFNDVTEKKKLEAQFLRSQRMESIGTLAGGIAHDLNNVLTPLLFAVQALKDKVSDEAGRQMLDILETNVRRGASLVKQVLIFGRGIKGERITVQPRHLGREIEHIVRETFPKSLKFESHCPADLWTITGDPTQIEQVLLNLCVNARDAMPGGGKLSLRMENTVLDENQAAANLEARPGRHVVISVTDTGAGMTREIQDRIFEPFFTTKEPGKGTGLGLSTTLAIVKSHGGFINCYSEPGRGSVFKVYLPASPDAAVETRTPAHLSSLPCGHNELVLVVDDEEPIRNLAQTMLERFGYRVLLAANGAEAVKLYTSRRNEIALVITDMSMPVMDGPATIAALQAINPNVKIIGSSGLDMNDGAAGAVNTGLKHFIPKPYTAETLLNTLHEVLREGPVK